MVPSPSAAETVKPDLSVLLSLKLSCIGFINAEAFIWHSWPYIVDNNPDAMGKALEEGFERSSE